MYLQSNKHHTYFKKGCILLNIAKEGRKRQSLNIYLGSGPSTELSEGGTSAGAGSTEEEGAASTELPSSSNPKGRAGEGQSAGEEEILEGEEGTAWVEDDGSSGFSGL